MSTPFDESRLCTQPPEERLDAEAPHGVDPAQVHGPRVAHRDGVQASEPDNNSLGRQLLAAIEQAKAMQAAQQEPVAVASAPPTREEPQASSFDVQETLAAVERASATNKNFGSQLLAAINEFKAMQAAQQEPVAVAPAPPTREEPRASSFDVQETLAAVERASEPNITVGCQFLAAINEAKAMLAAQQEPVAVALAPPTKEVPCVSSFDMEAAFAAVEQATTEEEAMAAVMAFVGGAETVVKAASDPLAALAAIFGSECVDTVMAVCAETVVDLEAEAAATGGPITDRAASRIARTMVQRVTRRADSMTAHALRSRPGVPRARSLRAPRARRAPRRAVRLAAVASAGDGPPPPPPSPDPHARTRARGRTLVRSNRRHLLVAPMDGVAWRLRGLRARDLTSASRAVVGGVMRRRLRLFRVALRTTRAVGLDALVKWRRAARPRSSPEQVQQLGQARDAADHAALIIRAIELVNRAAIEGPRAWSSRRAARAGHRDAPRRALAAGGSARSARAPRQSVDDVIAKNRPAFAPMLRALRRDALGDELRLVGDTDPVGSSSTQARRARRTAGALARSGRREGMRRVDPRGGSLHLLRYSVLDAWSEAHPLDATNEQVRRQRSRDGPARVDARRIRRAEGDHDDVHHEGS